MIVLVGTGHVFDLRRAVQEEVLRRRPEVVALELDANRYHALRSGRDRPKEGPMFYRLLARFQERLAETYGVEAGDEMLAAADAAQDISVPIALIDKDAQSMFQRLWREMGLWERVRFMGSAVGSLFIPGGDVEEQLEDIQDDYATYLQLLGERYPTMKRVLLDERNQHMANALDELGRRHDLVVAVVGDGHVDEMQRMLVGRGHEVETVRLRELRARHGAGEDEEERGPGASASFTVEVGDPGASPP